MRAEAVERPMSSNDSAVPKANTLTENGSEPTVLARANANILL